MAEDLNSPPQPQSAASPTEARASAPSLQAADTETTPNNQMIDKARSDKANEHDSVLKEVAVHLRQAAAGLGDADKPLAQLATDLAAQVSDAVRINSRSFQHEFAYTVQDVETSRGVRLDISYRARAEVDRLAGSAPGLENERLQSLLGFTREIQDRGLVQDIRRAGTIVGQLADQSTPDALSRIENLENRTRLTSRPPADRPSTGPITNDRLDPGTPDERQFSRDKPAVPADSGRRADEATRQDQTRPTVIQSGPTGELMNGIFRAMRGTGPINTPPWEPGAQPFGNGLSAFEGKMQKGRDDMMLRGAERSGRAVMDALEGFRAADGAIILNRIREAARSAPGGMASVLSEMREGGKFAELRQQFNNALSDERGASASYDRAASALASYGEVRQSVEQVIARRPDAANLSAKFEAMDKDIGAAAADIPSRRDGKSMIDDLSKQVADMLQKAFDGVKSFFTRGQSETVTAGSPRPN